MATPGQIEARKKSAETGKISWIKKHCLRDKDKKDDYVFISYKSDDYEEVLDGIVYKTCYKYGLRVYFDVAFDEGSDLWIKQFYKNMCDQKCKAIIAFVSNKYYTSYATLMEAMAARTKAAGRQKYDGLFFLPINLEVPKECEYDFNTGLGTRRFKDNTINRHAEAELKQFNKIFKELSEHHPILKKTDICVDYQRYNEEELCLYNEQTESHDEEGDIYLNSYQCHNIMDMILPSKNDNDGSNKDFVEVIRDKLVKAGFKSVFENGGERIDRGDEPKIKINGPTPVGYDYYHITAKDVNAVVKRDSHNYTLLKDSMIITSYRNSISDEAKKIFNEKSVLKGEKRLVAEDITEEKLSLLAEVIWGEHGNENNVIKKELNVSEKEAGMILSKNTVQPTDEVYYLVEPDNENGGRAIVKHRGTGDKDYILLENSKVSNDITRVPKNNLLIDAYNNCCKVYAEGIRLVTKEIQGSISMLCKMVYGSSVSGDDKCKTEISKEEAYKILSENAKLAGLDDQPPIPPTPPTNEKTKDLKSNGKKRNTAYDFTIYGKSYTNSLLKDMVITLFETLLTRYPDKLDKALDLCSSSLRKGDLIGKKIGDIIEGSEVTTRFNSGKVLNINGTIVSIGTHMSADSAIGLVRNLFKACGENKDVFYCETFEI